MGAEAGRVVTALLSLLFWPIQNRFIHFDMFNEPADRLYAETAARCKERSAR